MAVKYNVNYYNDYMKKRYQERRARAIEILGGCCVECRSKDQLELDHKNPDEKEFSFGKIWNNSLSHSLTKN